MFSVYIWIDGDEFNADGFQTGLDPNLPGRVHTSKRIVNGVIKDSDKSWKSEIKASIADKPEEELFKLVMRYKNEIIRAKTSGANRIFGQIVAEYKSTNDISGFYLSENLIHLLAELGMSIDIDVVPNLKD